MSKYMDLIREMEAKLPAQIATLDAIKELPWAGNAAWDTPIMQHVTKVLCKNESYPLALRKQGFMLAAHLMTGIGKPDDPISDQDFYEQMSWGG